MSFFQKLALKWHAYHFRKSINEVYVASAWCRKRGLVSAAHALDQVAYEMCLEYTRMISSA